MLHKMIKVSLIILCFFLLYVLIGALAPFAQTKTVSQEFQSQFQPTQFYSDTVSVDRAAIVEASMDALTSRIQMIHQAQEQIIIATFDMREDQSARDVCSALLAAADRGVQVQLLVDGAYGTLHMSGRPLFYALGSHENVEIRFYNIPNPLKPWSINGRLHDKYFLIDDKLFLTGGRNIFDYFLGEYDEDNLSYDRDILIYNTAASTAAGDQSVIAQVNTYFEQLWNQPCCETVFDQPKGAMARKTQLSQLELADHYQQLVQRFPQYVTADFNYTPVTTAINKATLIANPITPGPKEPWIWYQLQYLMKQAQQRVYIHTPYAVFSQEMYADITAVAQQVPDFKMMVNAIATGDNFMASSDYLHNRQKIVDTGVTLYELFGEYSSHGKSLVIDDRLSVIGSFNFDMRSAYINTEVMLVVDGQAFNQQLAHYIQALEPQCVQVASDGTYTALAEAAPNTTDAPPAKTTEELIQEVPPVKQLLFEITSRVFQLFRYLI